MSMIEVKTSELEGAALDWAVAKALNLTLRHQQRNGCHAAGYHAVGKAYGYIWYDTQPNGYVGSLYGWNPSRCWKDGGPLIAEQGKRIGLELRISENSASFIQAGMRIGYIASDVLIAACRAIVGAKLGDTVQVPDELVTP